VAFLLFRTALEAVEDGGRRTSLAQQRGHRGERSTDLELAARSALPVTRNRGALCARECRYRRIAKRKLRSIHQRIQKQGGYGRSEPGGHFPVSALVVVDSLAFAVCGFCTEPTQPVSAAPLITTA
jgi:hypothetical protein